MRTIQKKICLLGDFAVGKTSLIRRFVEGRFDDEYLTTVGVVVSRKSVFYPEYTLNLLIWDLAGGRDFSQSAHLIGVAGAMLVCDLTRPTTLATIRTYAGQVRQVNPQTKFILLANKCDLMEERIIQDEQLHAMAEELNALMEVTSAKIGYGVDGAFKSLADALINLSG
jgi:small GTP-binding protein